MVRAFTPMPLLAQPHASPIRVKIVLCSVTSFDASWEKPL
jgi:hypothetical protein